MKHDKKPTIETALVEARLHMEDEIRDFTAGFGECFARRALLSALPDWMGAEDDGVGDHALQVFFSHIAGALYVAATAEFNKAFKTASEALKEEIKR